MRNYFVENAQSGSRCLAGGFAQACQLPHGGTRVDALPCHCDRGFEVIALPMKIAGGTGGPLRIIAVVASAR